MEILIAEENDLLRSSLVRLLRTKPGLRIIGEMGDGLEAVKTGIELRPDVLIIDHDMPTLDGIQVTERVRKSLPNIHVILISTNDAKEEVHKALNVGVQGYVLKKSGARGLMSALDTVMNGELYLSPDLPNLIQN
jgi:DNA-binding NarL/FixJ family response regulator